LARRDRKGSLNDGQIQKPSARLQIVPLYNCVPRDFGFVHHSIAILYHEVPNPNLTIRNFFIAVTHPRTPPPIQSGRVQHQGSASLMNRSAHCVFVGFPQLSVEPLAVGNGRGVPHRVGAPRSHGHGRVGFLHVSLPRLILRLLLRHRLNAKRHHTSAIHSVASYTCQSRILATQAHRVDPHRSASPWLMMRRLRDVWRKPTLPWPCLSGGAAPRDTPRPFPPARGSRGSSLSSKP
jgi:hypothetical protein